MEYSRGKRNPGRSRCRGTQKVRELKGHVCRWKKVEQNTKSRYPHLGWYYVKRLWWARREKGPPKVRVELKESVPKQKPNPEIRPWQVSDIKATRPQQEQTPDFCAEGKYGNDDQGKIIDCWRSSSSSREAAASRWALERVGRNPISHWINEKVLGEIMGDWKWRIFIKDVEWS